MRRIAIPLLVALGSASPLLGQAPVRMEANATPFYRGVSDVASLTDRVQAGLTRAGESLDRMLAVRGRRTPENTLRAYDDVRAELSNAGGVASITFQLHSDPDMRRVAESLLQRIDSVSSGISLNRAVGDALMALDVSAASPEIKLYVEREVAEYRRQGVGRDDATMEKLRKLRADLAAVQLEFTRNIREGVRRISVKPSELDGLPADFIAARPVAADGMVVLTTEAPDVVPILTYARSDSLRRRLYTEFQSVGHPRNVDVLKRMVRIRHEIAQTLGYRDWASYDVEDRMAGTSETVTDFIARVVAASGPKMRADVDRLLAQKRLTDPSAQSINPWELSFYTEQLRRREYDLDSQALRPYFAYDRVRDGVLDVSRRLFGFEFVRIANAPVWHAAVEVYEVFEAGKLVGRIYLDMHPRAGKAGSGASAATVRRGIVGKQLPEVVLICRFSGGDPGDPGLMTREQVTTFFHEFGHLVHSLSSGQQEWFRLGGVAERDFVEAPSQMLEEWASDPAVLATFAKHYQTNQPIPADLVARTRRASELGRALNVRQQMVFAGLSLALHTAATEEVDPLAIYRAMSTAYLPDVPFAEGTYMPTSFSHLANGNYAGGYYTYMWSLVIAKDLFSAFDPANLLDPGVARRYRESILARGGSKPASEMVRDFLGRPSNLDAWTAWLNRETP